MHIFTLYELPLLKVNNKDKLTELLMIKNKKIILKLSKVENLILLLLCIQLRVTNLFGEMDLNSAEKY